MRRITVTFDRVEQIYEFVRFMGTCDFDADVKLGSRMVDAKSIVGVLSLAKNKTVEVVLHTEECQPVIVRIAAIARIAA